MLVLHFFWLEGFLRSTTDKVQELGFFLQKTNSGQSRKISTYLCTLSTYLSYLSSLSINLSIQSYLSYLAYLSYPILSYLSYLSNLSNPFYPIYPIFCASLNSIEFSNFTFGIFPFDHPFTSLHPPAIRLPSQQLRTSSQQRERICVACSTSNCHTCEELTTSIPAP